MNPKSSPPIVKKPFNVSLPRAPIVAVLGHVDHGKTSLLDAIRHTHVQASETGGITQHIGAYQAEFNHQPITFIDTPGHAAFAKMRQRGAQATDLVVLVVAANEGVKPQTKESIQHIKAANVPLVIAINKMDMPGASPDMVKAQLAEQGIIAESYGGDTVCVETIATKGTGIDQLLEMILLVAQMQNIVANPTSPLEAVIIESSVDKRRGVLVSVVIKNGTLKVGDEVIAGTQKAKIRALFNHLGQSIALVTPGEPAEILGFTSLPAVGEIVRHLGDLPLTSVTREEIKISPAVIEKVPSPEKTPKKEKEKKAEVDTKEEIETKAAEKPRIKAIIKADTQGTLEAIKGNVAEEVERIGEGVGEVSESDVLLAESTGAKILAFRVPVSKSARKLAEIERVPIHLYQAIYDLLEDLEKQILKLLEPTIDEEVIGVATIIAQFTIKEHRIAGCNITSGKIDLGGPIHLMRKDKIIGHAKITSLRQGSQEIQVAKKGEQCGILLKPNLDFKVGDTLQYYRTINEDKSAKSSTNF